MRKLKQFLKCLSADFYRAFVSFRCLGAILLVIGVMFVSTFEGIALNQDVLYLFSIVMYGLPSMLILIGGAFGFADSICQDIEHKYITSILIRSGINVYVASKVLTIFMVAIVSVTSGIVLYVLGLHLFLPWVNVDGSQYQTSIYVSNFSFFLENESYFLYFLFCGLQYSILAGMMALISSYFSLYIKNKMLILATPFILFYFIDFVIVSLFQGNLSLSLLFSPPTPIFGSDLKSIAFIVGITIVVCGLVSFLIKRKIWRDFYC